MKGKKDIQEKHKTLEEILGDINSSMIDTSPQSQSETLIEDYQILLERDQSEENKSEFQANNENKLSK